MSAGLRSSRCSGAARLAGKVPSPASPFDFPKPIVEAAGGGGACVRRRRRRIKALDSGSSCSSSIGRNSDSSGGWGDEGSDDEEVQSSYKGPLDTMDDLQEALPIRQDVSKCHNCKSKSFTSLVDVPSPAKDVSQLDNAYNRKRKAFLTSRNIFDWNQTYDSGNSSGSIPKKLTCSSCCTSALVDAVSSSESNTSKDSELFHFRRLHSQAKHHSGMALTRCHEHSSSRSLSLSDLLSENCCSSRN